MTKSTVWEPSEVVEKVFWECVRAIWPEHLAAGHDIHHKTADQPKTAAKATAQAMRHAAR